MAAIRFSISLCALSCALSVADPCAAEPPGKTAVPATNGEAKPDLGEPEAVAKERARLLYEKGVSAYREGRYYDAVDIFLETNRLYPDPKLSYNIGKAFEGMSNQPGALRYYREYLRRLPEAPDAREVEGHVRQLEQALSQKGVQQLTIISTPDGSILRLDGQAVGVTPWTGESFAGKHRIVLESDGYQRLENVIEVDPHRARDFNFELQKASEKPPADLLRTQPPARAEPKATVFTLSTLGTGLALFGTALIAQVASGGDSHGISKTAAFFGGAGTGVSVLGSVMLYFDLSPRSAAAATTGVSWNGAGLQHGMTP